jgi:hypothetical protein
MNWLDVSHATHNLLFYTYVDVVGSKLNEMDSWRIIDVGINMGRRELMKQM